MKKLSLLLVAVLLCIPVVFCTGCADKKAGTSSVARKSRNFFSSSASSSRSSSYYTSSYKSSGKTSSKSSSSYVYSKSKSKSKSSKSKSSDPYNAKDYDDFDTFYDDYYDDFYDYDEAEQYWQDNN